MAKRIQIKNIQIDKKGKELDQNISGIMFVFVCIILKSLFEIYSSV